MKKKKGTKNKKASTQDEAGLATGGVSLPTRRGIGTSRWGNRLWGGLLLLLLFLMLKLIRTIYKTEKDHLFRSLVVQAKMTFKLTTHSVGHSHIHLYMLMTLFFIHLALLSAPAYPCYKLALQTSNIF